jgi:hypothetical protein
VSLASGIKFFLLLSQPTWVWQRKMILFGLSILFVLSAAIYVAKITCQDMSITFLIFLLIFSGLTYKRRMKNDLKILNNGVEVAQKYCPQSII